MKTLLHLNFFCVVPLGKKKGVCGIDGMKSSDGVESRFNILYLLRCSSWNISLPGGEQDHTRPSSRQLSVTFGMA